MRLPCRWLRIDGPAVPASLGAAACLPQARQEVAWGALALGLLACRVHNVASFTIRVHGPRRPLSGGTVSF